MKSALAALLVLAALALPPGATAGQLTAAATGGVWLWDASTFAGASLPETTRPVFGLRAGYAPGEALSFEAVYLTGTVDLESATGVSTARGTQVEGSVLVHFRSLVSLPVYPFIAGGAGWVHHGGVEEVAGEYFTPSRVGFHLGAGLRAELGTSWAARFQVRDTFFPVEQSVSDDTTINADRVEVSLALEALFAVGAGHGGRLR
jgi:hypothetical protein